MLRVSMHCSCIHNDACMHVRAALRRVVAYCVSSVIHATCSTPAVRASESGSSSCRPLLNILPPCVFNAFVRTLVLCYVELILLAVRKTNRVADRNQLGSGPRPPVHLTPLDRIGPVDRVPVRVPSTCYIDLVSATWYVLLRRDVYTYHSSTISHVVYIVCSVQLIVYSIKY